MMAALVLIAWLAAAALVMTAAVGFMRSSPVVSDRGRGRWGMLDIDWQRSRRLDPQQLRWQTALIAGRKRPTGWSDLVADIERLERSAGVPVDPSPPERHDRRWLHSRLAALEVDHDQQGEANHV